LHYISRAMPGDAVPIHAIGGGVGLQLTQLAKMADAAMIGTVRVRRRARWPLARTAWSIERKRVSSHRYRR
jgi:NADPH:quinone reductase-like Zn-dependent oxidoreductase